MCAKHTTLHNSIHTERGRAKRYSSVYIHTYTQREAEAQRTRDTDR